jgi:transcriptional regulator with XRE-family HTH domain
MRCMRFDEDDAKAIGSTLQSIRRAVGWTQEEMAERCDVSASTYSRHEAGEDAPSARLMVRYSRELGLLQAEFYRVHDELQKARRRVRQGASWWRGLDRETLRANDRAVSDRRLLDQFGQAAGRLMEAMQRRLNQG